MKPVPTIGHTIKFTKPVDWNDKENGPCGTLSVRTEYIQGHDHHFSTWRPSPEELQRLLRGECVELCCVGVQPPVAVGVAPEAEQLDPPPQHGWSGSSRAG